MNDIVTNRSHIVGLLIKWPLSQRSAVNGDDLPSDSVDSVTFRYGRG